LVTENTVWATEFETPADSSTFFSFSLAAAAEINN
jgi:hypothetical protein